MKSLDIVQKISKVLHILSIIALVGVIVGAVSLIIGGSALLGVPYFDDHNAIKLFVMEFGTKYITDLGINLIAESIFLFGLAITLGYIRDYFKHELEDGTPFTHRGANELRKVGIFSLTIPIGALCLTSIVISIAGAEKMITNEYEMTTGVAMILLSFVFHYGADLEKVD